MTAKAVTEPGAHPEREPCICSALPKDSRPLAPITSCSRFRSIGALVLGDDQKQTPLLVLEEQVLGVHTGNVASQLFALRDCEGCFVSCCDDGDAQGSQMIEQLPVSAGGYGWFAA